MLTTTAHTHRQHRPIPRIARVTAFLSAILTANLAPAQTADLSLRWQPDPVAYRLTETMHQTISGPLQAELRWRRTVDYTERAVGSTEAGTRVERSYDRVAIAVTRDAEPPVRYDSQTPDPETARSLLIAPFVALAGKAIRFTVDDEGKVSEVEGAQEALDAMLLPLEQGTLTEGLTSSKNAPNRADRIARQIEQALRIIPDRPVRPGDRWPVEIDHETPLAGSLTSDLTATLKGLDRTTGTANITLEGDLTQATQPAASNDAPDTNNTPDLAGLLGITLDSGKLSGTLRFDQDAGQIAESTLALRTAWTVGGGLTAGDEPMKQTIEQKAELERRDD